jgi:predicted transposase YbfD/YdcC
VAGLASGQLTPAAIGQWVREHAARVRGVCGDRVPSEATLRRVLARTDVAALEECLGRFAQQVPAASAPRGEWQVHALDGKTVRGVGAHGVRVHLVSEVSQPDGRVLQQRMAEQRSNEIPCVQAMLRGRDLRGIVLTLDAMHTQRATARLIVRQQGHYLMVVKANQPELYEALTSWFAEPDWGAEEAVERVCTHDAGHGRLEWRTAERRTARTLALLWPGAQQAIRRHCLSLVRASGEWREDVSFALTSLPAREVGVAQLEAWWRGHWTIENRVHYVRDVTWHEDGGQARAGATPHVLAALRNSALMLVRRVGHTNIAAALRHYGASALRALRLVGLCL